MERITPEKLREESLQDTQLYKDFKKALNINHDMRPGDNPFVVARINIANQYALSLLPSDEEIKTTEFDRGKNSDYDELILAAYRLGIWHLKEEIINKLKS